MFQRMIVVLVNSIEGRGRCIAGKDLATGRWVRLAMGGRKDSCVLTSSELDSFTGSVTGPRVLDILCLSFDRDQPSSYHPEDSILTGDRWSRVGSLPRDELPLLMDRPPWELLDRSEPLTDVIMTYDVEAHPVRSSLVLLKIAPQNLARMQHRYTRECDRYRPRLLFRSDDHEYDLPVTDPSVPQPYYRPPSKEMDSGYVVIGLSEAAGNGGPTVHHKMALTLFA
jgi:hypothetical protein